MINQISFQSRREVVYNLESAARQAVKFAEIKAKSRGPRPIALNGEDKEALASMKAYLDSAVFDEFSYSIEHYDQGVLHDKQSLAGILTKKGDNTPFKIFEEELLNAVKKHNKKAFMPKIKAFLSDIASRIEN